MKINQAGIDLIKHFEGLRLEAYKDVAGVLTIGYGHTGPDVLPNTVLSNEDAADALLRQDLSKIEAAIKPLIKQSLNDNQFSALVSFAFNLGIGALKSSTLLRVLNVGNNPTTEFLRWNKAKVNGVTQEIKGLTKRRQAEADLYNKVEV